MIEQTLAPVHHSVVVALDPERAFDLFTAGFDSWWPREHHIGTEEMATAVIEPREGGRVYEIGEAGGECDWGKVTTWDPPARFVVAWQLNGSWQYDPDLEHASEYEVTFTAGADGGTVVELEHRHFERHGADGSAVQGGVRGPDGWADLLGRYADQAAHR
jgi:hypothetical protein